MCIRDSGMAMAVKQMRAGIKEKLETLKPMACDELAAAIDKWIATMDLGEESKACLLYTSLSAINAFTAGNPTLFIAASPNLI